LKAFITSTGEPTTQLCVDKLKENGFEVVLLQNSSSLADKLKAIYSLADDDFVRVDGDVIPNNNLTPDVWKYAREGIWWLQFLTFDWFKWDVTHGGVQFIRKEALEALRANIDEALDKERPESYMYRLEALHNPRRCLSHPIVMGLHGYKADVDRVKEVKDRRGQAKNYDFKLTERVNRL
jgi:hypothetical protein